MKLVNTCVMLLSALVIVILFWLLYQYIAYIPRIQSEQMKSQHIQFVR